MKYLEFEHLLPMTLDEAWSFFSSPANLNLITPDDLDFKILDTLPDQMYQGLMIRYTGDIIAMSPPLIVSKAQIDEIVGKLGKVLAAID